MSTTRTFIFYKAHFILTQSLRLKSYLKPFLHFGLPLDQNGLDVCPDETGLEGLIGRGGRTGPTGGTEVPGFASRPPLDCVN